jgi:hypothetical protein
MPALFDAGRSGFIKRDGQSSGIAGIVVCIRKPNRQGGLS